MADVPPPALQKGRILVRTAASLISAGTERMTVELGRRSLLGKARERPDLVQQVIQKVRTEGLRNTFNAVRAKLDSNVALGYSAAGLVVDIDEEDASLQIGDRVACAGAGFASHAEVVSVPKNLCVRVPENVGFDEAAFGTLGAISLQGVRLAEPTLGEAVVVIGLGLIGQLTVQLLRANGCRVFGVDPDRQRADLALLLGAEQCGPPDDKTRAMIAAWSRGRGADAVLITAATQSNEPLELAGEISRLKGRVVAVGLVGLNVPRNIFYHKELTLKISMSYGPGRYDPEYEERGHDYPFGYVRWTEGRNIEAFLDLVASGQVNVERLITHRFSIDEADRAYSLITGETAEPYLGVLLRYDTHRQLARKISLSAKRAEPAIHETARIGLIGAGSYAKRMLLPNFKAQGAEFQTIATASGVSAREIGEKYGFRYCVSDADEVIGDSGLNLIVIATRHDTHAELVRRGLLSGHHVFVEKPLALNEGELQVVLETAAQSKGQLMVGFNRRFSPLARAAKDFFQLRQSPLSMVYRINAGRIPRSHWIQDPLQGGRIIGEVCHFIDLMQFLAGSPPLNVYATAIGAREYDVIEEDSVLITLRFADGSNGSIAYLAEGDKALAKERVEIYGGGRTFVIDDFRLGSAFSNGKERRISSRGQDKGQADEVKAVCEWVTAGGPAPISLEELAATSRATFCARESLRTGMAIALEDL